MIENIDPLTEGKMMWPVPEPPVAKRVVDSHDPGWIVPQPAHKVRNSSRDEQDEVAKGRVEKPVRPRRARGTIK